MTAVGSVHDLEADFGTAWRVERRRLDMVTSEVERLTLIHVRLRPRKRDE
jgi:hypothetical protein